MPHSLLPASAGRTPAAAAAHAGVKNRVSSLPNVAGMVVLAGD
jgi:hypothetical protein